MNSIQQLAAALLAGAVFVVPAAAQPALSSSGGDPSDGQTEKTVSANNQNSPAKTKPSGDLKSLANAGSLNGPEPSDSLLLWTPGDDAASLLFLDTRSGGAMGEALDILAEIVVERAKRDGLGLVKRKLENAVCEWEYGDSKALLPRVCELVRTTELMVLVDSFQSIRSALALDLMEATLSRVDAVTKHSVLEPAVQTALTVVFRALESGERPTSADAWLVADAVLNAKWSGGTTTDDTKSIRAGMFVARGYVNLWRQKKVPPSIPEFARALAKSNADLEEAIKKDRDFQEAMRFATLAVEAATATVTSDGQMAPDTERRLAASVDLVFGAALRVASTESDSSSARLLREVAISCVQKDYPGLVATMGGKAADEIFSYCNKKGEGDDRKGRNDKEREECRRKLRKPLALVSAVTGYSATFAEGAPSGSAKNDPEVIAATREARKEVIEQLIDATTDRTDRYGEWVVSLGAGAGLLVAGKQDLQALTGSQDIYSQLSLPIGPTVQRLPGKEWFGIGCTRHIGLHFMATLLDIGQYAAWDEDNGTTDPDWQTLFAPGGQVGLAIGTPTTFFVVSFQAIYAPDLTDVDTVAGRERTGGSRYGASLQYFVPLFDFN